jgi:ATP-binding cassette subfamily B protein
VSADGPSTTAMERLRRRLHVVRGTVRTGDRRRVALVAGVLVAEATSGVLLSLALKGIVDAALVRDAAAASVATLGAAVARGTAAGAGRVLGDTEILLATETGLEVDAATLRVVATTPGIDHLEHPGYLDQVSLVRGRGAELMRSVFAVAVCLSMVGRLALAVVLLGAVDRWLVLVPLFTLPTLLTAPRAGRHIAEADLVAAERRRASTQLHGLFLQRGPAMELRVANGQAAIDRRSAELWDEVSALAFRGGLRAALVSLPGWIVLAIGYSGALLLVGSRAVRGDASIGDLVLVSQLVLQLLRNITEATTAAQKAAAAMATIDRFGWLEDMAASRRSRYHGDRQAPATLREGIRLEGVGFTYPDTTTAALHDIDLVLPAGAVVAVVGPNGAGKTTLAKLLAGLYLPTSGRVLADDVDLAAIAPEDWARHVSGAFQDFLRLEASVRDSVGAGDLGRAGDDSAVQMALADAGAGALVDRWPDGLDTTLGRTYREGVELSGGQWQRIAVARAMMRRSPLLLVLDEPTSALDPAAEHALYERYAGAARRSADRGGVTVLISHRFSSVRMADLIVVLDAGTVVELGSHDELVLAGGLYHRMFHDQANAYR